MVHFSEESLSSLGLGYRGGCVRFETFYHSQAILQQSLLRSNRAQVDLIQVVIYHNHSG